MNSNNSISVYVPGTPVTQGSKRAFVNRKTGKAIMVESAGDRLHDWRAVVRLAAREAGRKFTGAVKLNIGFQFVRPKSHFGTGRNATTLKASAPKEITKKPDIDKLQRAILDALTGVVYDDDSQVVSITAFKKFGSESGCHIMAWEA